MESPGRREPSPSPERLASDSEKAPFLPPSELSGAHKSASAKSFASRQTLSIAFLLSAILNLYLLFRPNPHQPPQLPVLYSPANSVLRPQLRKFNRAFGVTGPDAIYTQPPSAEVDQAWRDLYVTALGISHAEAAPLLNKTVPLSAKPSARYLMGLSVFHDLHCLDSVRKVLWASENAESEVSENHDAAHLMHCVDNLRESLMCHADVAPLSWQWSERGGGVRVFSDVVHECRDFDAVLAWGRARVATEHLETDGWEGGRPLEIGKCGARDEGCGP